MDTYTTEWDETFTISTRIGSYYDEPGESRIIEAHDEDGTLISELYASLDTGQIMQVHTVEEHRGEGIATALVTYAVDHGIELYHSPAGHRTDDGARFAERANMIDTIPDGYIAD